MERSWVLLKRDCPIPLDELLNSVDYIETLICPIFEKDKIEDFKQKLIVASTEIEILLSKLTSLLYNVDAIKTSIDQAIYDFLKDDLSAYVGIIDDKQNKLLEAHDGEPTSGVGRTSAFKKVLNVALYGIIYNSLMTASKEYHNYTPKEGKEKDNQAFLRILFLVMSINLSVLGGLPRRKAHIGTTHLKGQSTIRSPWAKLFTPESDEVIRKEYKERYDEELPLDLISDDLNEGDLGDIKVEGEEDGDS